MDERLKAIIRFFDDVTALMDLTFFRSDLPVYYTEAVYEPATEVYELEDRICILIELPGVDPKDLQIAVGPTMVVIKGVKYRPRDMQQAISFYNSEIPYGYFRRQIYLPTRIVPKATSVSLEQGVLKLELIKEKQDVRIITFNE
jgi:HSP20 family protein